jgi:hypothetical protein
MPGQKVWLLLATTRVREMSPAGGTSPPPRTRQVFVASRGPGVRPLPGMTPVLKTSRVPGMTLAPRMTPVLKTSRFRKTTSFRVRAATLMSMTPASADAPTWP